MNCILILKFESGAQVGANIKARGDNDAAKKADKIAAYFTRRNLINYGAVVGYKILHRQFCLAFDDVSFSSARIAPRGVFRPLSKYSELSI
jgi:hypothetical protein